MAAYHPSRKLSKLDEPDIWETAGEVRKNMIYSCEPPSHGRAKAERPARTYMQQLCADTGCSLEDLPGVMDGERGSGKSMLAVRHDDDNNT